MKLRVGIFGGTFDPVHNGHVSIAQDFIQSRKIDELWVMPAPDPPHKGDAIILDFEHRMAMLKMAFSGQNHIIISDFEKNLPFLPILYKPFINLKRNFPLTIF